MGEYYPAEIRIGGNLPAQLLEEFFAEIRSTGATAGGFDGPAFDCKNADDLRQTRDEQGRLVLADAEASYGQFEGLEVFCLRHGILFDRHSDAHYEFDAENVYFRPGMKHPAQVSSNNCGDDLMAADEVRTVAKALVRLAKAKLTKEKLLAAVAKAGRKLKRLLPPEVEPLPPLEVI
jgi:hypothetical protein